MTDVYVVTDGTYSDYHIVGIFSTQERAEAFLAYAKTQDQDGDDVRIEVYRLDELAQPEPGTARVWLRENGELFGKEWRPTEPFDPAYKPMIFKDISGLTGGARFMGIGRTIEHARRSAEELRRQTLALEGKVVTDG